MRGGGVEELSLQKCCDLSTIQSRHDERGKLTDQKGFSDLFQHECLLVAIGDCGWYSAVEEGEVEVKAPIEQQGGCEQKQRGLHIPKTAP